MEQRYPDNLVIGHYKGMAIVENEFGTLFYIEDMDEGMAPAGTVVEDGLMESIQNLRKVDRDAILRAFGGVKSDGKRVYRRTEKGLERACERTRGSGERADP